MIHLKTIRETQKVMLETVQAIHIKEGKKKDFKNTEYTGNKI